MFKISFYFFFHKLRLNVDYSKIWCYECVCMWLSFYYRISFAFRFQWNLSILSIRIMRDVMENAWINRCVIPSYRRFSITALYVHHQMIREWKLKKFLIFISGHKLGCIGFGTVNFGIGSATVQYSLSFGRSDPIVLGFLENVVHTVGHGNGQVSDDKIDPNIFEASSS